MINLFKHWLFPQSSNNYRAKLLHHKSIIFVVIFLFLLSLTFSVGKQNLPAVLGASVNISIDQLLSLTNQQRHEYGLQPLSLNQKLDLAAENKASDMFKENYWAHDSPSGKTPWDFITAAGYNYAYAGENLARGFSTASDTILAWMASPEHRANMLSSNYRDVGFAVKQGVLTGENTTLIVEVFGSTQAELAALPKPKSIVAMPFHNVTPVLQKQVLPAQIQQQKPLVNSSGLALLISAAVLMVFVLVFVLDIIVVDRNVVFRKVGHNIDHIFFLSIMFFLILILIKGSVL